MNESRTVLVVDDEEQLRRLIAHVIGRAGTPVLTAGTAREARQLFREHAGEISVVLLDVTMPDGEGAAILLPEFVAAKPSLRVIVMSGDALPPALETELDRVGGRFLRKPFVPKALLRLLEEQTAASPGRTVAPPPVGPGGGA